MTGPGAGTGAKGRRYDAVVVGAGFAGMYMLHRLHRLGLSVKVYEEADGVGGTWHWNRYPGARVDVQSTLYSYGFDDNLEQEWSWSQFFAYRDELVEYADHVADRFDLRKHIEFNTRVSGASWDDQRHEWHVETGPGTSVIAKYLVPAVGCLSATNVPSFPGLESFRGERYHSARWPSTPVDFRGKRVGLIGTGSTGIQIAPIVAAKAKQLTVFQRTANYSLPIDNREMDPDFEREWKRTARAHRTAALQSRFAADLGEPNHRSALAVSDEEREAVYEAAWPRGAFHFRQTFDDLNTDLEANRTAADFIRRKIRSAVGDPEVADLLAPSDHPFGSKRVCMDTNYYQTYNRDNVSLVDVRSAPIVSVTPDGVRTTAGDHSLDVLILATGFDAMTGALLRINPEGRDGRQLSESWKAGPQCYLGLAVPGFPNLFTITGPGSPSVLSNMMTAIEQHVDWIADAIVFAEAKGYAALEVDEDATEKWVDHVNDVADGTLFRYANSWYRGANISGKPQVFMPYAGGFNTYYNTCVREAESGYSAFVGTR